MRRDVAISEISDGKRYLSGDMVRTNTNGCRNCHQCCTGMGESIVLDPHDIAELCKNTGMSFQELLEKYLELHVVDNLTLPNLKMVSNQCSFLTEEGRCRIHEARPGICRLFPMARVYEGDSFYYLLQTHECVCNTMTKVKVEKWLGIPQLRRYEEFILAWHEFLRRTEEKISVMNQETASQINIYVLQLFYVKPYMTEDFYSEAYNRLKQAGELIQSL